MEISSHSNFNFLENINPNLCKLIGQAENQFQESPNNCLMVIGQFAELLALDIAQRNDIYIIQNEKQYNLIEKLKSANLIDEHMQALFHEIRMARNVAAHPSSPAHKPDGDPDVALEQLRHSHDLAICYYKKFVNSDFVYISSYHEKLEENLDRLAMLKAKEEDLIKDRERSEERKKIIERTLLEKKMQAEKRKSVHCSDECEKINSLNQEIDQIDLKLIRIEMEISDLSGFTSNIEIMSILRDNLQQKEKLEHQREQRRRSREDRQNSISSFSGYSEDEELQMHNLSIELAQLSIHQGKDENVKDEILRIKNEIKSLLLEIRDLHNRAQRDSIKLELIPFGILQKIDNSKIF